MNDHSQVVVGVSDTAAQTGGTGIASYTRAFRWTPATGMHSLGTLGGLNSGARDVNELGHVVGWSNTRGNGTHAFLWTDSLGMTDLGPSGRFFTTAEAINDSGVAVGTSEVTSGGDVRFAIWLPDSSMTDLDIPVQAPEYGSVSYQSPVVTINDAGRVAGIGITPEGEQIAWTWTVSEGFTDIGSVGGRVLDIDLNDQGHIIGISETDADEVGVSWFIWTPEFGIGELGSMPPFEDPFKLHLECLV